MGFIPFISFNKVMHTKVMPPSPAHWGVKVTELRLNQVCLLQHSLKVPELWQEAAALTKIKQQHGRVWKTWAQYLWWHEILEEVTLCVPTGGSMGPLAALHQPTTTCRTHRRHRTLERAGSGGCLLRLRIYKLRTLLGSAFQDSNVSVFLSLNS